MNCFTDLWNVKLGDFGRGLIVAICTVPITIVLDSVNAGSFDFDWKKIAAAAVAGGLAYIVKNFLTGANGKVLTNK